MVKLLYLLFQMELSKRNINIFIASCIIIILLPTGFYLYKFWGYNLSSSPGDWGVLGDYIGGILNPFVAILNILLLVYLTIYVDKQDHKKMFNQFRYDAYLEFSKLLNSYDPKKATIEETATLYKEIDSIAFSHQFLFEGKHNTTYQKLLGTILSIILNIQTYKSTYEPLRQSEKEITDKYPIIKEILEDDEPPGEYLFKNYEKYPLQRKIFIGFIQRVIANGDTKPYENWDIEKFVEDSEKRQEARNKKD